MAENLSKNGKNGKNDNGASRKIRRTPPPQCGGGREYGQRHLLCPSINRPPPPVVTRPAPKKWGPSTAIISPRIRAHKKSRSTGWLDLPGVA
ncbi:hypothetical protein MPSD_40700 [Mycobacterium pseudoshottsii JCM 15466]|nr:hypothetical protein MPSD_40700 [Mycobacterium pseudoshottsii JCM 15466]